MNVHELNRKQLVELKQSYLVRLADEGNFISVIYDNGEEERNPSYSEMADADTLVPDDIIFDTYSGTCFSTDDFSEDSNSMVNEDDIRRSLEIAFDTLYVWIEERDVRSISEALVDEVNKEIEGRQIKDPSNQDIMICVVSALKNKLGLED